MTFNVKFNLLEEKETEVLQDLMKALTKPMPDRNQNEENPSDADKTPGTTEETAPPVRQTENLAQEAST